ncbi:hypothetical protein HMN09_00108900 [Mycena chlorophos]|uniref:Uncharacterized protein n=1 Tax=Mycena chlorophos TaxID=658473 RepID=A0A8H6WN21_MYCCL|nr:hypothetical protein HMN09_00108900 [Mycena chlorophos]
MGVLVLSSSPTMCDSVTIQGFTVWLRDPTRKGRLPLGEPYFNAAADGVVIPVLFQLGKETDYTLEWCRAEGENPINALCHIFRAGAQSHGRYEHIANNFMSVEDAKTQKRGVIGRLELPLDSRELFWSHDPDTVSIKMEIQRLEEPPFEKSSTDEDGIETCEVDTNICDSDVKQPFVKIEFKCQMMDDEDSAGEKTTAAKVRATGTTRKKATPRKRRYMPDHDGGSSSDSGREIETRSTAPTPLGSPSPSPGHDLQLEQINRAQSECSTRTQDTANQHGEQTQQLIPAKRSAQLEDDANEELNQLLGKHKRIRATIEQLKKATLLQIRILCLDPIIQENKRVTEETNEHIERLRCLVQAAERASDDARRDVEKKKARLAQVKEALKNHTKV